MLLGRIYWIIHRLTLRLQLCDKCTSLLMVRRHLEEKLHSKRIDLDDLLKEFHRCWTVIRRTRAAIELVSSFLSDSSVENADKKSDKVLGKEKWEVCRWRRRRKAVGGQLADDYVIELVMHKKRIVVTGGNRAFTIVCFQNAVVCWRITIHSLVKH